MTKWISGMPTFPWSDEWFHVKLDDGYEIELYPLPKEWSYQWKDRDETYYTDDWTKRHVVSWKQREESQYVDYEERKDNTMKKYVWRYWFHGIGTKKPSKQPKDCQWLNKYGKWLKDEADPRYWYSPRRWKVALKTCKWCESDVFGIINPHTGVRNEDEITYCPTCGKPVEIVKKGAK